MSGIIRWEDPEVAKQARKSKWQPVADELRKNPGRWALVFEGGLHEGGANSLVAHIRTGKPPFEPRRSFEARQCTMPGRDAPRKVRVYARYLGGEPS